VLEVQCHSMQMHAKFTMNEYRANRVLKFSLEDKSNEPINTVLCLTQRGAEIQQYDVREPVTVTWKE
jgi:hypothetical protein